MENDNKFRWQIEVVLFGNDRDVATVYTETEDWYEAEAKVLAMPGVWDVGDHYWLRRPDGTRASI